MLHLFPDGFEEVEREATLELAVYADADGAVRVWRAFGEFTSTEVAGDWEERWRRFHRAARVGDVWIGPPWLRPPSDALPVVIDPGRAFGTGAHQTTRLCVELISACPRGSLLDAGTGSGVLAIAASKLGFDPVTAVDHDEAAVEAARANASLNGVDVDVRLLDVLHERTAAADLVTANLSCHAVEQLARCLSAGLLITSGYLAAEELDLPRFEHRDRRHEGGWAADLWERAS